MAQVECLSCGETRESRRDSVHRVVTLDACGRCGYLGWAPSPELSEPTRRLLRDRPVARRRFLSLA